MFFFCQKMGSRLSFWFSCFRPSRRTPLSWNVLISLRTKQRLRKVYGFFLFSKMWSLCKFPEQKKENICYRKYSLFISIVMITAKKSSFTTLAEQFAQCLLKSNLINKNHKDLFVTRTTPVCFNIIKTEEKKRETKLKKKKKKTEQRKKERERERKNKQKKKKKKNRTTRGGRQCNKQQCTSVEKPSANFSLFYW